jgi:hypothetical protein
MIETDTIFKDSGFDCDHCGGEILKRIDRETGQPDTICYQCRECGCQWALGGDPLRVGSGTYCRAAQKEKERSLEPEPLSFDLEEWAGMLSKSVWILVAIVAGVILLVFGGGIIFRYLLPVLIIGVAAFLLIRYARNRL